ncbi:transcriptional regulator [Salipaludibacillus keqinensis]|uniref:Transcriptional regulator n=1 Tax=Salipaludibacillus keqinensis TaxID=2045207 RepID=A0A323T8B1_9BACI|nr:metalloregulator ArsR/SmtB family transcription factor [Salipaludibacillus keqinensis]PYZ92048.1 transcriptional regulator [Salipaludibacillus keqinensis]
METTKKHSLVEQALLFKMMNDENRLKILLYLYEEELCVCNLIDLLNMSQPAVSQHLKKLRQASIIQIRSQGQWKFYRLNEEYTHLELLNKILAELPSMKHEVDGLNSNGRRVFCTTIPTK